MTLPVFLVLLGVAISIAALAQGASRFTWGGCLVSIVLGFIGAYLGGYFADQIGLPAFLTVPVQGQDLPIFWPTVGAAFLIAMLSLISGQRI